MYKKLLHDDVIKLMKQLEPKYDFSKFKYVNARTKSTVICDKGHEYEITYNSFQQGHRCPHCAGKYKFYNTEDIVSKMIELESKYNFSKFIYNGTKIPSTIICNNGHEYKCSWDNFNQGKRCPHCSNRKSKQETEIIEFIKTFYNAKIEQGNRKTIPSPFSNRCLELDIYIPDLKLAIEFNGRYWHTDDKLKKRGWNSAKEMHDYKVNECFKKGIKLIHIDEDDYLKNKDSVLETIKNYILN